MPALVKAALTSSTKRFLVRYSPDANLNRGPGAEPLQSRKERIAATGQSSASVRPTNRQIPRRNGSVFDCLIETRTNDGFRALSTATSDKHRCTPGSYDFTSGVVISPTLRKAKKQRQQAAHMSLLSGSADVEAHTPFNFRNTSGVIGKRSRRLSPMVACTRFTPFRT